LQDDIYQLLPVAHKYGFEGVVYECLDSLTASPGLFDELSVSGHQGKAGWMSRWLKLAEELQLEEIRALCVCYLNSETFFAQLSTDQGAPGNIIDWLKAATQLKLPDFRSACIQYLTSDERFLKRLSLYCSGQGASGYVLT
jgi:hypothetical protein